MHGDAGLVERNASAFASIAGLCHWTAFVMWYELTVLGVAIEVRTWKAEGAMWLCRSGPGSVIILLLVNLQITHGNLKPLLLVTLRQKQNFPTEIRGHRR